jgi:hypothetical protein
MQMCQTHLQFETLEGFLIIKLLSHTYPIVQTSSLLPPLEHLSLIPKHQTA